MVKVSSLFAFLFIISLSAHSQFTYYVATDGQNDVNRDGRSLATAWKSLAFACDQIPEGAATIELGKGTFEANKTAVLKSGFTVVGQGAEATILTNAAGFSAASDQHCDFSGHAQNYLISVPSKRKDITIKELSFSSSNENPLYGAIHVWDSDRIEIQNLIIRNFSWAGLYLNRSGEINVEGCLFEDASYEKHCSEWGGGMRTRYVKYMTVHDNEFKTTKGGGYGYKGSGHEDAKFYNNTFHNNISKGVDDGRPFDFESAHEFDWGLEIFDNVFNGMVSVPRGGAQGLTSNSTDKTYEYSIHIHNNTFYGSGGIEGPRSHLEIDHNYFAQKWNNSGRVYEVHGGENPGPVKIHHNVAECSMGFVFKKNELNENVSIYNNTVYLVNSDRNNFPTSFLEVSGAVQNWQVKNNIVFSDDAQSPDKPSAFSRGSLPDAGINLSHNVAWKVVNVPEGVTEADPQLVLSGEKPTAYYAAKNAESYVVDQGTEVGFLFEGTAPDLGAYEWKEATQEEEENEVPQEPVVTDTTIITSLQPSLAANKREFLVYPNPTSNTLTITQESEGGTQLYYAKLSNTMGETLIHSTPSASGQLQFDLSEYTVGVYFVHLHTSEGKIIWRIMKR
ncbi:MAG: T9SS type A sorting domain-containing protein [Tunicatimonas sp.]|uniref:T9SS type A sorting domain-containing protein n=1 Tax=Tunicatimonas sp. TaxID=1940096 RepID=UPI003C71716E